MNQHIKFIEFSAKCHTLLNFTIVLVSYNVIPFMLIMSGTRNSFHLFAHMHNSKIIHLDWCHIFTQGLGRAVPSLFCTPKDDEDPDSDPNEFLLFLFFY